MGIKFMKKEKFEKTEIILSETYKDTDIEFSPNEVTNFKLRIRDAENYFRTRFENFFNFNNYIFRERLYYFYENFNHKIELFSKTRNINQLFNVLIDFEDESISLAQGFKIDFESLFVIIFEKLEINIILFFYMTNVDSQYVSDFLSQMIENADLYKYNRKFDCLYFLFANLDYFIKNDCAILYASSKLPTDKNIFSNSEVCCVNNEYMKAIFQFKEKLIIPKYPKTEAHNYIEHLLDQIKPNYIKLYTCINFSLAIENFISENEDALKLIEFVSDVCPVNNIEIDLCSWMDLKVLELFIKKIVYFVDKSSCVENLFCLKIMLRNDNSHSNEQISKESYMRKLKLKSIQNYVSIILRDLNIHNQMHFKRKIVIELFEVFDENIDLKLNKQIYGNYSEKKVTSCSYRNFYNYMYVYEKLLFHWFLPNKKDSHSEIKKIFSVIINEKKYKKLKNKKIIQNISGFISISYRTAYLQRTRNISKLEMQEIFK